MLPLSLKNPILPTNPIPADILVCRGYHILIQFEAEHRILKALLLTSLGDHLLDDFRVVDQRPLPGGRWKCLATASIHPPSFQQARKDMQGMLNEIPAPAFDLDLAIESPKDPPPHPHPLKVKASQLAGYEGPGVLLVCLVPSLDGWGEIWLPGPPMTFNAQLQGPVDFTRLSVFPPDSPDHNYWVIGIAKSKG